MEKHKCDRCEELIQQNKQLVETMFEQWDKFSVSYLRLLETLTDLTAEYKNISNNIVEAIESTLQDRMVQ